MRWMQPSAWLLALWIAMPAAAQIKIAVVGPMAKPRDSADRPSAPMIVTVMTALALPWLLIPCLESSASRSTLGKDVFGLIVVDREGRRISFPRALARGILKLVTGIGFFVMFLDPERRALHDLLAGTKVLRRGSEPEAPVDDRKND